jgi:hypothetical protein
VGSYHHGKGPCRPVERMAQERAILVATACGEADEVACKVSFLEGELMAVR